MPANDEPLKRWARVQREAESDLNRLLSDTAAALRDRIARLPEGGVRQAQLRLVLNELNAINQQVWTVDLLGVIQDGRGYAMEQAQEAVEAMNRVLFDSLPPDVAQGLSQSLRATARAGIATERARVPRELSSRVWDNAAKANGHLNRAIRTGLVQGLSARELAQSVYQWANPRTPGGQSYAAMRLARTEINNAFHNQQRASGNQIGVEGHKWNLSDSHPKPDECDEYANHQEGLGVGVWAIGTVPDKPHPHCFCYITYKTLTSRQFARAMLSGQFDGEIDRRVRSLLEGQRQ